MGSPEKELCLNESTSDISIVLDQNVSNVENNVADNLDTLQLDTSNNSTISDASLSKEEELLVANTKKIKKKSRHGKKGPPKENLERSTVRRLHHASTKFKQTKKRAQSFPSISKFFLPYNRPRKEAFIPPTKFLLGGNISDPLNLNSLKDEDINRAMNAVTPKSSPLPTPPRHKAKIDVIIPPNIRDPLNLIEPLDNEEYEKRLEMQQRKKTPRKKPRTRHRMSSESIASDAEKTIEEKEHTKDTPPPEPSTSKSRKRSCSDSDNNSQKCNNAKKLRRMESLDKIVSPVVPQPGAWMRARPQQRVGPQERPASPHRAKLKSLSEGEQKLPTFNPKHSRYQYGNYDKYYGYRNLNSIMDIRLEVFKKHKSLFQNKDVLDIGCNVGHISIAIARTLGIKSVVGIDIDNILIGRARKNLNSFIPMPQPKREDVKKTVKEQVDNNKPGCNKCTEEKCGDCLTSEQKKTDDDKNQGERSGRKVKRPRKNRKAKPQTQRFFPISMSMMYGPLGNVAEVTAPAMFPHNVTFKQGNYVPQEDVALGSMESPQFDLILCLSTTKWLHLNWGDAGLKRAFKRMFNDLRPGGKLVLEAQNWTSYKKKKRLTPTIYENFNSIELFPNNFREYLLSPEVGFSKFSVLGVPQHASKGFSRPIHLYVKGDFSPSTAPWSDAYAPSSHHRQEVEPPRRTVYAPVAPAYRPSDDAPTCGAVTPYSPNLDCSADDSPFYNPRSDSYAPSYAPPRPTVYASVPSLGGASPAPHAPPAADPLSARGFPAPERRPDD